MKKTFLLLVSLLLIGTINFTQARNSEVIETATTIYHAIDVKYKVLPVVEQQKNRKMIKSVLYKIKSKNSHKEVKELVEVLIEKTTKKISELQIIKEKREEKENMYNKQKKDSTPHETDKLTLIRSEMLKRINQERSKVGSSHLKLNDKLNASSQSHANYMNKTKDFSHTTKTGSTPSQRMKKAGYSANAMGENIAWNQKTVNAVMNSRMNSKGHKANILNPKYTEVGIGFSNYYRVQNFGG